MTHEYNMITVKEYLNILNNKNLNSQDIDTMISIEKYLSEVISNNEALSA